MPAGRLIAALGPALMLAAGLGFALGAVAALDLGSVRRMGPGAFPLLVGGLLALLSLVALVREWRAPGGVPRPDPRAVAGVALGVVAFAFVTPNFGVLPGAALSVLGTASITGAPAWPARLALAAAVAGGVWAVFVVGLGLPLPVLRWP
jgi:putative tricarboxylic transport membrane protein